MENSRVIKCIAVKRTQKHTRSHCNQMNDDNIVSSRFNQTEMEESIIAIGRRKWSFFISSIFFSISEFP